MDVSQSFKKNLILDMEWISLNKSISLYQKFKAVTDIHMIL